jgi:hypothetical protein
MRRMFIRVHDVSVDGAEPRMKKTRLAIVVSHPIQHFVHFYRAPAATEELEVKAFFCSPHRHGRVFRAGHGYHDSLGGRYDRGLSS